MWKPVVPPFKSYKKKVFREAGKVSGIIFQIGEYPELRKPSKPVSVDSILFSEMQEKFTFLKNNLKKYRKLTGKGRGIAAVQVGIPERFSVIYVPRLRNDSGQARMTIKSRYLIIVNPKITKESKEKFKYPEMCMSANPIIAPVVRPAWIEFEYYTETGKKAFWNTKAETKLGRMMNRVFQHEIDHMEGIINIDRVDSTELILESDPEFYDTAMFENV